MNETDQRELANNPRTVLNWYDFICPFCYVGQQRNSILVRHGFRVEELAYQAHPDIPPGGIPAGPRNGLMYATLEREAKEAGLPIALACTSSQFEASIGRCRVGPAI